MLKLSNFTNVMWSPGDIVNLSIRVSDRRRRYFTYDSEYNRYSDSMYRRDRRGRPRHDFELESVMIEEVSPDFLNVYNQNTGDAFVIYPNELKAIELVRRNGERG
jgi:hypothetical protein